MSCSHDAAASKPELAVVTVIHEQAIAKPM